MYLNIVLFFFADLLTPTVAALTLAHLDYLKQQQQLIKKLRRDRFDQHPHLKQQRELLTSIPGIGDLTASILLAEIGDISDYDNARQLAAYAGLTRPRTHFGDLS